MRHTNPSNIMWFARPADVLWRRRRVWWMIVGVSAIILIGSALVNQITLKSTNRSLAWLEKVIPDISQSPALQQIVLTALQAYRSKQPVSSSKALALYHDRYQEQCLTDSSNPWCQMYPHRDEILDYLWYTESKTYLILLQNSAEVRPNGWFYGSFVRVTLSSGTIDQISVHDSYEVPFTDSWVVLNLPERSVNYLGDTTATFIAGNKFGFTDRDGLVISSIYNKTYQTNIDGVIFVSTDTLLKLIPSIQTKLRERQFINASVDLIRGQKRSYKKELYVTQLKQYIDQNKIWLITQAYSHLHDLFAPWMLQVYLPDSSPWLRQTLLWFGWITDLADDHLYARDLNQSYNKIGTFVSKQISIINSSWQVLQNFPTNIIDGASLASGRYQLLINYDLKVPQYYVRTIRELERQYQIELTDRETHILWLDPVYEYKSVVFAGSGIIFDRITWDVDQIVLFDAGLWDAVAYHIPLSTWAISVTIDFTKSE